MLLAVNIGNSNIRFAVMEDNKVHLSWTIATKPYRTAGEFYITFQTYKEQYKNAFNKITKIVIGSVVPQQTQIIAKMLQKTFQVKPFVVNRDTPSAVSHHSNQMGTDLYANAVASHYLYPNQKKIIIDFGTATTYDVLKKGVYIGGGILPGIDMSINALYGNTAKLPRVKFTTPSSVLGTDTMKQIQAAIFFGYAGQIKHIIKKINEELNEEIFVLATGGLGKILSAEIDEIDEYDPNLSLYGLYTLYKLNK